MIVVHTIAAAQHCPASAKQIPGKTYARIVEKRSAGGAREGRRRMHLVTLYAGERSGLTICSYRAASSTGVKVRIPGRKAVACGIHPGSQMREPHPVIQGEKARNLPGVRGVKFRRHVAEGRRDIKSQFRIVYGLPNEHVSVSVASAAASPRRQPTQAIPLHLPDIS